MTITINPKSENRSSQRTFFMMALAVAAVVILARVYHLDSLHGEWYGDVVEVRKQVDGILAGRWPDEFVLGCGPLYGYLITPLLLLTGPTYLGFKMASVVISLGVLLFTYVLGRQLLSKTFALLATFISGVSSWLLIFSRLGNIPILVPLLVVASLWLVARIARGGHWGDVVACAVVAAAGMWVYPQAFILPAVTLVTLVGLHWSGLRVKRTHMTLLAVLTIISMLLFVWYLYKHPQISEPNSYLSVKLITDGENPLVVFARNAFNALLALHVRGDVVFRSNVRGQPHLDVVSGILFLVGVWYWLRPERRRWSPLLLVPFLLLQVPSMLALNAPGEVPSASRTAGIAPLSYILVASGLWWLMDVIGRRRKGWAGLAVGSCLLAAIVGLNAYRYFVQYTAGLPYGGIAVGRSVSEYANSLSPETRIYVAGCCWVDRLPEIQSIQLGMDRPDNLYPIDPDDLDCRAVAAIPPPAVLIWSFEEQLPSTQLEWCPGALEPQLHLVDGRPVFYAAPVSR